MKKYLTKVFVITAILAGSVLAAESDRPVLKDAYKKHFLIGGAFNRNLVTGRDPKAAEIASKQFNTATSENDMKWSEIHPQQGQYNWVPADSFMEFCEKYDIVPIGHTLVWHSQCPNWVFQGKPAENAQAEAAASTNSAEPEPAQPARRRQGGFGGGFTGPRATRDELLERMRDHIHAVVGRYKGRIKGWDVVNEALNDDGTLRNTQWLQIIGEGKPEQKYDFIAKAFEYAHEADPDCELYYNDYNLDTSPAKCDGAIEIVKHLKSKGLRIDGVGIQLHAGLTYPQKKTLEYAINAIAEQGVKVMVTELDVRTQVRGYRGADVGQVNRQTTMDENAESQETQDKLAEKYSELFNIFMDHKEKITRVTLWGVYDTTSWIGGSPLLFDKNYKPKKAYDAVIDVALKRE